jgi:hypothetical protein
VKLVEEQVRGLNSFDGRDLSVEVEDLRVHVARVEDERAAKAMDLSTLFVDASNALVDLGMLPIQDIPQLPKMAHNVLKAVGVILQCLQEEHASVAGL